MKIKRSTIDCRFNKQNSFTVCSNCLRECWVKELISDNTTDDDVLNIECLLDIITDHNLPQAQNQSLVLAIKYLLRRTF